MRILAITSVLVMLVQAPAGTAGERRPAKDLPPIETILQRLRTYEDWQEQHLREYQVQRTFHAANPRFNLESTLEVRTVFRKPNSFDSEVLRSEGSKLIRERVFDKLLEAEEDSRNREASQSAITPENYNFELVAREDCEGRPCYRLKMTSKRKEKYNIDGDLWVDAEDGAIRRMHGSPAKRPSFWALHTEIDRRYKRINGFWLFESMETNSDIFVGGHSILKVAHSYVSVVGED
jgi:hypothetical protein